MVRDAFVSLFRRRPGRKGMGVPGYVHRPGAWVQAENLVDQVLFEGYEPHLRIHAHPVAETDDLFRHPGFPGLVLLFLELQEKEELRSLFGLGEEFRESGDKVSVGEGETSCRGIIYLLDIFSGAGNGRSVNNHQRIISAQVDIQFN